MSIDDVNAPVAASNPYLEGNMAPVPDEITVENLPVTGEIPEQLDGRWLRNGPNPIDTSGDPAHWFVGDGMVHGVRIRGGRAEWYRNRWVRSESVAAHLGTEVPPGDDGRGGPNTSVGAFAGSIWAMVEAGGRPARLTDELETIAYDDFGGTLPNGFTAHPKYDRDTGELHAVCYSYPDVADHVQYMVVGPDATVTKLVEVPVADMPMIHDMSLTASKAIVYDLPVTVDIEMAMQGASFPMKWNPDHGARVGLLDRGADTADDIVWVDVPLSYVFHPLNAYDTDDGKVVLDICRYDKMFDLDLLGPVGDSTPTLDRWTVDPATRTVHTERIDDRGHEFPIVSGRYSNTRHRFGYTSSIGANGSDEETWFSGTNKIDFDSGAVTVHDHGPGRGGAEPLFIPRDGGTAEDDGWLMVLVYDQGANSSDLVLLDAQDISGPEVARISLPRRVPNGFHGAWVS